jgi:hypothetical protein
MTMEDTVVPCRNHDQGRHHVDGNIMLTLPEFLQPFSWNCLPIFNALTEKPKAGPGLHAALHDGPVLRRFGAPPKKESISATGKQF